MDSRRTVRRYRDILVVLVQKEFKVRYKNTFLGYAWSLMQPLLFALVFYFVFSVIARWEVENVHFSLFLITGLFPWQWVSNSVSASNWFFLGNSSLIRKVVFPRRFLVHAGVISDMIHFVISIPVIVAFMLWFGRIPSVHWLWQVPLLVAVQFLIVQGLALAVATLNLFFRDLERITGIMLMLVMYLSFIIIPPKMLIEKGYGWLLYANPMASLTQCWRGVFLDGVMHWDMLGVVFTFAIMVQLIGRRLYRKMEWRFAEIV